MSTFPLQHNLKTSFSLMQVLCTYNVNINRDCIWQFSSLWQILYTVQNSTVTYNSIAHLLMESRTSDLPGLFKSVEGRSNLTQGQDSGCYRSLYFIRFIIGLFRELFKPVYFGSMS